MLGSVETIKCEFNFHNFSIKSSQFRDETMLEEMSNKSSVRLSYDYETDDNFVKLLQIYEINKWSNYVSCRHTGRVVD